ASPAHPLNRQNTEPTWRCDTPSHHHRFHIDGFILSAIHRPGPQTNIRFCRCERVKPTHIYARTGILTHARDPGGQFPAMVRRVSSEPASAWRLSRLLTLEC